MSVCGQLGHSVPDTHETKRPRGADEFPPQVSEHVYTHG